ncbi:MAG: HlyD family efflux transporter periplasmic adaptor subunit [Synergistaceae bacterium]|nr:HlyD family efflux transporter periplasmic adaptor subunit [Synergistaceae bacterium]
MSFDKRKLQKILYIYIAGMLVVIFSSRTIYNFTLPKITVAIPQSGSLTKEYKARVIISFLETFDIYAASNGRINEIFVGKGDMISPDTIIATYSSGGTIGTGAGDAEISYSIELIKNQLEALTLSKAAIQEKLRALTANPDDFYSYQRAIENAEAALDKRLDELGAARELAEAPFEDYGYQQAIADAEIFRNRKQVEAENMRILFEEGAVALIEAISAQSAAEEAERAYTRAVDELASAKEKASQVLRNRVADAENAVSDAKTALEDAEKNLDLAQSALTAQIDETRRSLDLELKRADLDTERANIDLRAAEASLNKDITEICADCQGVVISVGKNRGQFVTQGEKIATVGIDNDFFAAEITCSKSDGGFIETGDEASISKSGSSTVIKAVVYDITPLGDTLKISIICETEVLNGGEYVNVRFQKQTPTYDVIVPNEAIFREGMNNYVWTVKSRQGALGMEYYSVKTRVIVADSDDFYSAIARGLEMVVPAAPVIVSNDKGLTVNGRVRRME